MLPDDNCHYRKPEYQTCETMDKPATNVYENAFSVEVKGRWCVFRYGKTNG